MIGLSQNELEDRFPTMEELDSQVTVPKLKPPKKAPKVQEQKEPDPMTTPLGGWEPQPATSSIKNNKKTAMGAAGAVGAVGRTSKAQIKREISERDRDLIGKTQQDLMQILFQENKELTNQDFINIFNKVNKIDDGLGITDKLVGGKATGNTAQSPLHGVKQFMNDYISVDAMTEFIKAKRDEKISAKQNPQPQQQQQDNGMGNMFAMMPFFQQLQQNGFDVSKMDPQQMMMLMAMSGQQQGNNNNGLGQLMLTTMLAKMMNPQQQQQPQNGSGNNYQQQQPNFNTELVNQMYQQLQQIMQQPQRPAVDPNYMLMASMMKQQSSGNNENNQISMLLSKMNEALANNRRDDVRDLQMQNQEFMRHMFDKMENVIGTVSQRENPKKEFMDYFSFFKGIEGDRRQKTIEELNHDIEVRKLESERQERMYQRQLQADIEAREIDAKNRWIGIGEKLIGDGGIAQAIGTVTSSMRANKPRSRSTVPPAPDLSNDDLDLL